MRPGRASTPEWRTREALPDCLGDLSAPVAGLWCLGDPKVLEAAPDRMVAIVGTREPSSYGERSATRLAAAAARAGLVVVSGLARGIDAAAHRAAVDAGGKTVAVLGTGVDVPYPAGHRTLHHFVQDNGVVLSEVEPGTKAFRGCFPRRNRIIAALANVTVVVEAGFKSGAINSANHALELGRVVAAVPGQIDDPRAMGANLLIRDGAQVITQVEDLLTLYGLSTFPAVGHQNGFAGPGNLSIEDRVILKLLRSGAVAADDIAYSAGMSVRQVSDCLLRLQLRGLIAEGGGSYRLVG